MKGENVYMYDQPPPYAGIFQDQQQRQTQFDSRQRVNHVSNGFVDPNDPSKIYVSAPSAPQMEDAPPPSYTESLNKKKE